MSLDYRMTSDEEGTLSELARRARAIAAAANSCIEEAQSFHKKCTGSACSAASGWLADAEILIGDVTDKAREIVAQLEAIADREDSKTPARATA